MSLVTPIPENIIQAIEKMTYTKNGKPDHRFIRLGCYCLDFKHEYVFVGFTKNKTKVILGDIYAEGPDQLNYTKKFGKVEVRTNEKVDGTIVIEHRLITDGYRYSETIEEANIATTKNS